MAETSGKATGDMKEEASAIAKDAEGGAMEETEDWDKTRNGTSTNSGTETSGDGQFKSFGRSNGRGLAQLMSPHAPKGKELIMTEEEEKTLATELGKWASPTVNSPHPLLTGIDRLTQTLIPMKHRRTLISKPTRRNKQSLAFGLKQCFSVSITN